MSWPTKAQPERPHRALIEDVAEALAWADLVICRAGALTVAELSAVGVAAVLVPLSPCYRRSPKPLTPNG